MQRAHGNESSFPTRKHFYHSLRHQPIHLKIRQTNTILLIQCNVRGDDLPSHHYSYTCNIYSPVFSKLSTVSILPKAAPYPKNATFVSTLTHQILFGGNSMAKPHYESHNHEPSILRKPPTHFIFRFNKWNIIHQLQENDN
jgi:hypothetical protein